MRLVIALLCLGLFTLLDAGVRAALPAMAQSQPGANTQQVPGSVQPGDTRPPRVQLAQASTPPSASPRAAPVVQPHAATHTQKTPPHTRQLPLPVPPIPEPEAVPETAPAPAAEEKKGPKTKGPIPRFASLRFDDVNMRHGPGPRYPIDWVYKRRDLPVQIEREFDIWRLVRDADGTRGWVSEGTLSGRRTFIITGTEANLRRDANDTAGVVAVLRPGVIGRIRSCDAGSDWCRVQSGEYRGYLKRSQFWGTLPNEAVAP